jgi:hypothetical protein
MTPTIPCNILHRSSVIELFDLQTYMLIPNKRHMQNQAMVQLYALRHIYRAGALLNGPDAFRQMNCRESQMLK